MAFEAQCKECSTVYRSKLKQNIRYPMSSLPINKTLPVLMNMTTCLVSFPNSSLFPSPKSHLASTLSTDTKPQSLPSKKFPASRNQLTAADWFSDNKTRVSCSQNPEDTLTSPQTHINLNCTEPDSLCIPESLSIKGQITLNREGNNPQKKIWLTAFLPSRLQTTCSNEQPHPPNMTAPVLDH